MKKGSYPDLLILAGVTLFLGSLFFINPQWARDLYTNKIFALWRRLFGQLGFWPVLLIWGLLLITFFRLHTRRSNLATSLWRFLMRMLAPVLLLVIIFYWFWGFNYLAVKPEDLMAIPREQIPAEELLAAFQQQTITVNGLRAGLPVNKWAGLSRAALLNSGSDRWNSEVTAVLAPMGYNVRHPARILPVWPSGGLLRIGTAGFFNFFRAGPTVDTALHWIQIPNVSLHELAHAYGVSDEGSANFVAYLAGKSSNDTLTKYSTELSFWRSLAVAAHHADSAQAQLISNQLSPVVRKDIAQIRAEMEKYPDIAPELRDGIYNIFLKSQGVSEGMQSYGRYLTLVLNWKRKSE